MDARASQDRSDIERVFDKYLQSINTGDIALASEVWSQSQDVLVVTPIGRFKGWESVQRDIYAHFVKEHPVRNVEASNIIIVLAGNAAWLVYDFAYTAELANGLKFLSKGWESHGYQRTAKGWRIAHLHYSVPPVRS